MDALALAPALPGSASVNLGQLPGPTRHDPRRIDKVAQDFESTFFSLLLKELRESLEPETLFPQDTGDVLGSLFDMFIGQHLAKAGSLGIGAMVKKQLMAMQRSQEAALPAAVRQGA